MTPGAAMFGAAGAPVPSEVELPIAGFWLCKFTEGTQKRGSKRRFQQGRFNVHLQESTFLGLLRGSQQICLFSSALTREDSGLLYLGSLISAFCIKFTEQMNRGMPLREFRPRVQHSVRRLIQNLHAEGQPTDRPCGVSSEIQGLAVITQQASLTCLTKQLLAVHRFYVWAHRQVLPYQVVFLKSIVLAFA